VDPKRKILFITKDFNNRVEKSTVYLMNELKKNAFVYSTDANGDIQTILKSIYFRPDFILLNDYKPDYCPFVRGLHKINIPYGVILHDLKYKPFRREQFYLWEKVKHIFTIYRDAALETFPQLTDKMIWFPHHVPIDIFKDYQLKKEIDILMMGALIPQLYPKRVKFYNILQQLPNFVYHPHPGYKELTKTDEFYIGEKYAKEINRAKIFITCDSKDHFPLMKYFEALACKTLLLATPSKELEDLGFVDGKTFVAVEEGNLLNKVQYYLENEEERNKIVESGYQMVRKQHSTFKRAQDFLNVIEDIIAAKF